MDQALVSMKPSGGKVPDLAKLRILVPEIKSKSALRDGSKNAIFEVVLS